MDWPATWLKLAQQHKWQGEVRHTNRLVPLGAGVVAEVAESPRLAVGWTGATATTDGADLDGWLVEVPNVLHDLADLLRADVGGVEAVAPPKPHAVEVRLDPPQITLEKGETFALTPNQAVYLKALLEADDWLSDVEFRRRHPAVGENARPYRWRDSLPDEVKSRIETHKSRGSRWRSLS